MKSKNPKTLTVFTISYVCAIFYTFYLISLEFHEYISDKSEWFKMFSSLFFFLICIPLYIHVFSLFYIFIFKHFDAAIEFIVKALPYALAILFLAFMLYTYIFKTD